MFLLLICVFLILCAKVEGNNDCEDTRMITDPVMLTHKGAIKLTKDIRFLGKETLMMIASMAVLKTLE